MIPLVWPQYKYTVDHISLYLHYLILLPIVKISMVVNHEIHLSVLYVHIVHMFVCVLCVCVCMHVCVRMCVHIVNTYALWIN